MSPPKLSEVTSTEEASLAQAVIRWQLTQGRHHLPWQQTRDPYRVWLSEVMLQQTQVSTVLGYYERFLGRFPDVQALAQAPLDEVLALWSGLGYYSRARNLHACAQAVVALHGGAFPRDSHTLATLPGIGRSTAAAIAAFCFGERAAILDGNVKRVLTRVLGFGEDLAQSRHEKALWALAEELLPHRQVDRYTQGLMDLGAQVCTARQPRCPSCPLQSVCVAQAQDRVHDFPVKSRRVKRGRRISALWWWQHRDQVWLVRRPSAGVWADLWCLPELPVPVPVPVPEAEVDVPRALLSWQDHCVFERLSPVEHVLTHFDWLLMPARYTVKSRLGTQQRQKLESALVDAYGEGRWVSVRDALTLGLPAPVRKLLEGY